MLGDQPDLEPPGEVPWDGMSGTRLAGKLGALVVTVADVAGVALPKAVRVTPDPGPEGALRGRRTHVRPVHDLTPTVRCAETEAGRNGPRMGAHLSRGQAVPRTRSIGTCVGWTLPRETPSPNGRIRSGTCHRPPAHLPDPRQQQPGLGDRRGPRSVGDRPRAPMPVARLPAHRPVVGVRPAQGRRPARGGKCATGMRTPPFARLPGGGTACPPWPRVSARRPGPEPAIRRGPQGPSTTSGHLPRPCTATG